MITCRSKWLLSSTPIAQLVYGWNKPKDNRRLIRLKLKLSIQHSGHRNTHLTLILPPSSHLFLVSWYAPNYNQTAFFNLLFCPNDSVTLCFYYLLLTLKALKWVSLLSELIYFEVGKKNHYSYMLGSPLIYFLQAVLDVHRVSFCSLVPI